MNRRYSKEVVLDAVSGKVKITRNEYGVPLIEAQNWTDLFYGQGWVHAQDRYCSMVLTAFLGQGRTSEKFGAHPTLQSMDRLFRKMNFRDVVHAEWSQNQSDQQPPANREVCSFLEAYSLGVNAWRTTHVKPFEMIVAGIPAMRWKPEWSMLILMVMSYFGLAQGQEDVERFIIEATIRGTDPKKLEELFSPHLKGWDPSLVRQIKHNPLYPLTVKTPPRRMPLPSTGGSNCWVVSPKRTQSGKAILCNDPHLEMNRLPPIWHEAILRCQEFEMVGVTVPGVPGITIGRTSQLAMGMTYTMADTTDFWVVQCKNGQYFRDGVWRNFEIRDEKIRRKRAQPLTVRYFQLDDGSVLEGEPLDDGYYLAYRWAGQKASTMHTLAQFFSLMKATTTEQAMAIVADTAIPHVCWHFADLEGNIGFQIGGRYPQRKNGWSGLYPIDGSDPENLWQGFLSGENLPRKLNPPSGYIYSANNDNNQKGKPKLINMHLSEYRARRIKELLSKSKEFSTKEMQQIQKDTYSLQAERFLPLIEPYLDDSPNGHYLREWNFHYDPNSYAPSVFENIHREMVLVLLGEHGLGRPWLAEIYDDTSLGELLSHYLDQLLMKKKSRWWSEKTKEKLMKQAVTAALNKKVKRWGQRNGVLMQNLVLGQRLPTLLGFDVGPFPMPGGRATIHQSSTFSFWGKKITVAPSYRFIADLGENTVHTVLPGGESERRFSRWYLSDITRFFSGRYKSLFLNGNVTDSSNSG